MTTRMRGEGFREVWSAQSRFFGYFDVTHVLFLDHAIEDVVFDVGGEHGVESLSTISEMNDVSDSGIEAANSAFLVFLAWTYCDYPPSSVSFVGDDCQSAGVLAFKRLDKDVVLRRTEFHSHLIVFPVHGSRSSPSSKNPVKIRTAPRIESIGA